MSITQQSLFKQMGQGIVPASSTTFYTVPPGVTAMIKEICICNVIDVMDDITVYCVPNGQQPNDSNTILKNVPVDTTQTHFVDCTIAIPEGSTIRAKCTTANACSILITGTEVIQITY